MKNASFLIAVLVAGVMAARSSGAQPAQLPNLVTSATALRLVERGALLVEDFEAPEMNSKIWRVAHRNPDHTTISQQGGRLELTASGLVHMNGFWGLGGAKHKDLVLAGEMDVRSKGSPPHRLALHLCGGDGVRSPDHWVEILMVELRTEDGTQLAASVQSPAFGFYLLPLKDAPWDVYPVAAQIVLRLDGKPLGKPLRIERNSCEGLYPDDVYEVVVQ